MPQTKVNTPDGRVIKVNHPEGATEEEILRYAAMNDSKPPEESYVEGVSRRYKETDFAETVGEFMPELERRLDIKRIPDAPGMPPLKDRGATLPENPEQDALGLPMEMVYALPSC